MKTQDPRPQPQGSPHIRCGQEPGPATAVLGSRTPTLWASPCHLFSGGSNSHLSTPQTGKGTLRQRGSGGGRRVLNSAHLVPVQPLQVHQNPHQLGDGEGGVGVIELDGHLLGGGQAGSPAGLQAFARQRPQHSARAELAAEALREQLWGRSSSDAQIVCLLTEDPAYHPHIPPATSLHVPIYTTGRAEAGGEMAVGGRPPCGQYLIRESIEAGAHGVPAAELGGLEAADDVLERGSHYEVLLLQPQLLPLKELGTG